MEPTPDPAFSPRTTVLIDLRAQARALARQRRIVGEPPALPGFRMAIRWQGADGVSGDLCDAFAFPDGRVQVALGDVSGHGVGAALVMTSLLKSLRLRRFTALGLGELVASLNRDAMCELAPGEFVTFWIAEVAPGGSGATVTAGHHQAFIVDGRGCRRSGTHGPALALLPDPSFRIDPLALAEGEWLVQVSDGVLEATAHGGEAFGEERLATLLAGLRRDGIAIEDVPERIAAALKEWAGDQLADDQTILVLSPDSRTAVPGRPSAPDAGRRWRLPARRLTDGRDPDADYELGATLGSGGGGQVREARQTALGRMVAIKRADRPGREGDLLRESLIAAALDHPHILPVHEAGLDALHGPFLAMRRPEGTVWASRMHGLPLARNLAILTAVAEAAACAHRKGIVHRDIKPENVLLGDDGAVYLFDWGVATATAAADPMLAAVVGSPIAGLAAGSPAYMSPEMASGSPDIGTPSDVYLLGAVLSEVLAGHPPHPGATAWEALDHASGGNLPQLDPDEPLTTVVHAACAADPASRPADAGAFVALLGARIDDRQALLLAREGRRLSHLSAGDLAGHMRGLALAEEAARMRPGVAEIRSAILAIRSDYAEHAIAQGDIALAGSLVDPVADEHAGVRRVLANAREAQRRARIRQTELETLDRKRLRQWIPVVQDHEGAWLCDRTTWLDRRQHLRISANHRIIAFAPTRIPGDLRIITRLAAPMSPDARVGCLFAATGTSWATGSWGDGYAVLVGSSACILLRRDREVARAARPPRDGSEIALEIRRQGGSVDVVVDGLHLIRWSDPEPLADGQRDAIAVVGLDGWVEVRTWELSRLGHPEMEDLLDTAERHLLRGRQATAIDLLSDLAETAVGDRAARAAALLSRARAETALADLHRTVAGRVALHHPGAEVLVRDGGICATLPAGASAVGDLAGLPLSELMASDGSIRDIAPLAGMPLRRLYLVRHAVSSLEALRGSPLAAIHVAGNRITDLAPLHGTGLVQVVIADNPVASLEPLGGGAIRTLDISRTRIDRLSVLAGQPVEELWMNGSAVSDLGPLLGAPLQRIGLTDTTVASLAGLEGAPLRRLYAGKARFSDLRPLAGCPLQLLNIAFTPVTDLDPMAGSPLEEVVLTGCRIRSVAPLLTCPLRRLIIGPHLPPDLDRVPPQCEVVVRTGQPG